jgi:hypothetical protein
MVKWALSQGQTCFELVVDDISINGTGLIFKNDTQCARAGLNQTKGGNRGMLVNGCGCTDINTSLFPVRHAGFAAIKFAFGQTDHTASSPVCVSKRQTIDCPGMGKGRSQP